MVAGVGRRMLRQRHAIWPLVGLLLLPIAAATGHSPPDTAEFGYSLGGAASGKIAGGCSTLAVLPHEGMPVTLAIETDGGILEHYTTTWNTTVVAPRSANPTVVGSEVKQTRSPDAPLAPGSLLIDSPSNGRFYVFGPDWPAIRTGRLVGTFELEHMRTAPLADAVEAGTFFVKDAGAVATLDKAVPGPNRVLEGRNGTLTVQGDATVYLEAATIYDAQSGRRELPPAHESTTVADSDLVLHQQHRHHHALLRLTNARMAFDPDVVTFACAEVEAAVDGTFIAHGAAGEIRAGDQVLAFGPADLSLAGKFQLKEWMTPAESPPSVQGMAAGTFSVVGLDFQDTGLASKVPALVAAAAGAASLAALLGLLGWRLYTRLQKPVLLDLETRTTLHDAVRANPWATVADLQRVTGLSRSSVRYQLSVLRRHGLVRSQRVSGRPRVALVEDGTPAPPTDPITTTLETSLRPGPRRMAEVMRVLMAEHQFSRFGAWKAVRRATSEGLVEIQRDRREVWVRCRE